jgi:hypothetical protein
LFTYLKVRLTEQRERFKMMLFATSEYLIQSLRVLKSVDNLD